MDVAPWIWEVTIGATIVFFIFDVWHMRRNPHEPTMKECLRALSFYVGAAIVFGLGVWYFAGAQYGIRHSFDGKRRAERLQDGCFHGILMSLDGPFWRSFPCAFRPSIILGL